jgi:hypothetical protein
VKQTDEHYNNFAAKVRWVLGLSFFALIQFLYSSFHNQTVGGITALYSNLRMLIIISAFKKINKTNV